MRLACWQAVAPEGDVTEHLQRLATAASQACAAGADLLVTPELSLTGYRPGVRGRARTGQEIDELVDRATRIAADTGIALVYGYPERTAHGVYNTVHLVDGTGGLVAVYRKNHLYGSFERSAFTAGTQHPVQGRIGGLTVGLLICYDIEFPEMARAHALGGTNLLVVASALERAYKFVPATMVPTRAFENQFYLAYVNWAGFDRQTHYCGLSRVVDPHGRVNTAPEAGDHLLLADVDPVEIDAARSTTSYLTDRRPALYHDLITEI
jgi:predicted amidohydrolase